MSIDLAEFQSKARTAVKIFWGKREAARKRQSVNGKSDQGERPQGKERKGRRS